MKKLSTGQDSTLGNYRKLSVIFFGNTSNAVAFLDKKISEQSEEEEVLADESQMINMLVNI